MKKSKLKLVAFIAIPLAVGGLAALLSDGGMEAFDGMNKPPLSPPGWLFPVVWTILYILMGIASFLVFTANAPNNSKKKCTHSLRCTTFCKFHVADTLFHTANVHRCGCADSGFVASCFGESSLLL